ncbi:uncharacterized protein B0H18DRAFT_990068 [Fomitopsis serialis]|uniref:uncharacterized protein n=1 Tax=Fomitopsis serialis TaxID=139415 RepID=UPI0020077B35|nr:uncharacterized protein B0H18DRAFT_990068 [Neoantrodia serialis]KAH9931575.1 hypothetical protein B0H18DRAFT_990068 [Neoantrodia serialis]
MSLPDHPNATTTQPDGSPASQPVAMRRSRFFLEPEVVFLRVSDEDKREERSFKVHRYFLERDSELFRGMFACPTGADASSEGQTEETAVHLPDVTPCELECLMSFLYEGMYDRVISLADWVALLSVSSRLLFDKIRERAISAIEAHVPPLEPAERILLATKHDIPQWLNPAFTELCTRSDPLSDAETSKLGADIAERVERARDMVKSRAGYDQPGGAGFPKAYLGCGCKDCREARSESVRVSYVDMVNSVIKETISLPS